MKPLVYKKSRRKARGQATPVRVRIAITKGDTVQVMSGEEKGKRGKVLRVHPKTGRITIEGVNIVKRHVRATSQNAESGIIERAAPIHHSKAMLIDPKNGIPTRVRRRKDTDGTVERIAIKSGEPIPRVR